MIKKGVFLFGVILLALPFWLAVNSVWENDQIAQINQDINQTPAAAGKSAFFNVLDGSQYSGKVYPWIGYPVTILYEDELLGEGDNINQPPDEFRIKEVLLKHQDKKRLILQIDSWKVALGFREDDVSSQHVDWYLQVLKWAREVLPRVDIGFFGMPYSPWFALQKPDIRMQDYQRILSKLVPVLKASDSLYPSFFVQYGDSVHLFYTMITQLYIAKSFAKPVYPLLWQRGILTDAVTREILPLELVKKQCLFSRKYADGLVWWSDEGEQWEDGWYVGVQEACFD